MINIVVPMAGNGQRFVDAGYKVPKPFIDLFGKPMIVNVIENLAVPDARYYLIAKEEHLAANRGLAVKIEKEYGAHFIPIAKTTEGAACTILFAHKFINNDSPLLLANSDQIVDVPMGDFIGDCRKRNLDGSILTFQSDHPKWSYADVDPKTHLVTRVKEKEVISRFATVGVYYFEKGKTFVEGALDMIINNDRFNKEFYTCPAYNYSIRSGAKIGVYDIPVSAMHGCGTPEDLHGYLDFVKRAPSSPVR